MTHSGFLIGAALLLVACADHGYRSRRESAAVIVTTTAASTTAPTTTAPASSSEPTSVNTEDAATTTISIATTTTTSTTSTTTTLPTVGELVVRAEPVGEFERPVGLVPRPGTPGFYVVEQRGKIIRSDGDATTVAIELTDRLSDGDEQGLLGLAFSPDGGKAYLDFTDTDGTTTIAEYAVLADGTFDSASERILLTVDQPYGNHNAGDLAVDPDGLLYITLGDGGSAGDPQRRASDPTNLLGSILRIDPTPSADRPYSIPPDNPFADGPFDGIDGAPEVFAWGLRNPWKIAFDPTTGGLWIADVGQNEYEEVNVVGPSDGHIAGWGHDFGWSAFEGTERYNGDVPATDRMTPPVLTYPHADGACAVSGGVPYRGTAIPELEPAYVYSDYCGGMVWALDLAGQRNLVLLDGLDGVTAVRSDGEGELYVLQSGGAVSKLVAG